MFLPESSVRRMRLARRRLAQARQRVRRLAWMVRNPAALDAQVPLLAKPAFARALERFQAIRMADEKATLLVLCLSGGDVSLLRAVAMVLLESTRNCDTLGYVGDRSFAVLLKGADEAGAHAAGERLSGAIRRLAVKRNWLIGVRVHHLPLLPETAVGDAMRFITGLAPSCRIRGDCRNYTQTAP